MTTTLTRELETIFFIAIASCVGIFMVSFFRSPKHFQNIQVIAPLPNFVASQPTPTPMPIAPKTTTTSWTSSDGVKVLTMKTVTTPNIYTTYSFTLTDTNTNATLTLFIQTIPGITSMSIPFNAFSSDNSYVFLKETQNNVNHYLVFKTSGEPFRDGKSYFDVTPLFSTYTSTYTLSDVTGWASPTLLVMNTHKSDGTTGPSYWMDVTTRGFIPLATLFE